jgi:hypothetical protein
MGFADFVPFSGILSFGAGTGTFDLGTKCVSQDARSQIYCVGHHSVSVGSRCSEAATQRDAQFSRCSVEAAGAPARECRGPFVLVLAAISSSSQRMRTSSSFVAILSATGWGKNTSCERSSSCSLAVHRPSKPLLTVSGMGGNVWLGSWLRKNGTACRTLRTMFLEAASKVTGIFLPSQARLVGKKTRFPSVHVLSGFLRSQG